MILIDKLITIDKLIPIDKIDYHNYSFVDYSISKEIIS